jgi:hypothetical protein
VENDKYGREWHDDSSRRPPNRKPIPKGDHLLGPNVVDIMVAAGGIYLHV